jgi:hypothetical protein
MSRFIKLQIEFGGDVNELMVPYENDLPIVDDLRRAIDDNYSIPIQTQRLFFKGQALQESPSNTLHSFGILTSNKIRVVGRRAFKKDELTKVQDDQKEVLNTPIEPPKIDEKSVCECKCHCKCAQ